MAMKRAAKKRFPASPFPRVRKKTRLIQPKETAR
jgi:hypothetical protein